MIAGLMRWMRHSLVLLALCLAACSQQSQRPDLVLITLDTTRADALGCYGRGGDWTPVLDGLAREGTRFANARSVAPLTLPAHASMLTGLYPPRHGVRDNGQAVLPESAQTAAEWLQASGYQTAAFVSAAVLDASWGIAQGFEHFDAPQDPGDHSAHVGERSATQLIDSALDWLDSNPRERSRFLWLHLFDPHAPYEPPAAALQRAGGNAYYGEVVELDRQIGRFLNYLRQEQLYESSLILVVADHGEALGQHGEPTHSALCYEPVIQVPMILREPKGSDAPRVNTATVSVVDVLPTLLETAGIQPPNTIDGRSLRQAAAERWVYFESYSGWLNHGWAPLLGIAQGPHKYLWSEADELYDLVQDPREKLDLAASQTERCLKLREQLAQTIAGPQLRTNASQRPNAAQLARIKSLGYAGAADGVMQLPAPSVATGLPRPKDRMSELRAYYAALLKDAAGQREAAIEELQAILRDNPAHYAAADYLGAVLLEAGRAAEAEAMLLRLASTGRARSTTASNLARACEALGRLQDAREHWLECARMNPQSMLPWKELLRLAERMNDSADQREARARLQALEQESL